MGDELKVYIPSMIQPMLKLFMQDDSQQKLVTQKVISLSQSVVFVAATQLLLDLFVITDAKCSAVMWSKP